MFIFKQKLIGRFIFLMTAGIFLTSVASQFLLGKQPCQLCLVTRYLFLALAIAAIIFRKFKFLLPLLALVTVAFSFYHLGVESHWWQGPRGCISELPTLDSLNGSEQINPGISYCDRVNWTILGFSSTLWSFLFSMFIFWITSISFIVNYYLKKQEDNDD